MAITRANGESIVIKRIGPLMTSAGMDGTTVDGTNTDLNDPLGYSVRNLGYTVLSVVSIVDADVAQVTESQYDQFFDVATIRALYAILGNLDDVDITVGPRSEKLSQLATQVEKKLDRLEKQAEKDYGFGMATPTARVITLHISEQD